MALLLHYTGTAAPVTPTDTVFPAWRQNKPPSWSKNYAGEPDTCSLTYQGPQYKEAAFLTLLSGFGTLSYIDENGATVTDGGMFLTGFSSDDNPIFPTVTLQFKGCRGGVGSTAVPEDDITIQSASTTFTITDSTSPNHGKAITMSIEYRAARTSYEWTTVTANPGSTVTYSTVRKPLSYSLGSANITFQKFSGMVDSAGDPSNTISTADATAVWNSFVAQTRTSSFTVKEVVPGHVWQCSSTNEYILQGT